MQSNAARAGLLVALAAVAVVLFVVLSGGDDDGADDDPTGTATQADTATAPPESRFDVVTMRGGAPVGGVQELSYDKGDEVRIEVRLDEPQEDIHIHGYDVEKLNPSGTVRLRFTADVEGIFELEAHGPSGDVPLAEITVNP